MAGRGPQTFKKRQKEQQRKERQEEKRANRLQRKDEVKPAFEIAAPDESPSLEQAPPHVRRQIEEELQKM